jgi:predicted peptidase
LLKTGKILIKNGGYEYPITLQLIKDGRKNKVLHRKINSKIEVTMTHGQKDEVVPVNFSRLVLKVLVRLKRKL